jgi:hypothetical protein
MSKIRGYLFFQTPFIHKILCKRMGVKRKYKRKKVCDF